MIGGETLCPPNLSIVEYFQCIQITIHKEFVCMQQDRVQSLLLSDHGPHVSDDAIHRVYHRGCQIDLWTLSFRLVKYAPWKRHNSAAQSSLNPNSGDARQSERLPRYLRGCPCPCWEFRGHCSVATAVSLSGIFVSSLEPIQCCAV